MEFIPFRVFPSGHFFHLNGTHELIQQRGMYDPCICGRRGGKNQKMAWRNQPKKMRETEGSIDFSAQTFNVVVSLGFACICSYTYTCIYAYTNIDA